ncbi:MAG: magnesium transporter [Candidatus Hydrothermales bacterium]
MEKRKSHISVAELLKPEIKELIRNKNYRELKAAIVNFEPADIAELLQELNKEEAISIFLMLPKDLKTEVFSELDSNFQEEIIKGLKEEEIKVILSELSPDDRTSLFEELSPSLTRKLLNLLTPEERKETLTLLGYPKGSVGRLMTPDYVALNKDFTIKRAIEHIRKHGIDAETINNIYIVDENWRLLDDIPLRKIILADPNEKIESLLDFSFISITPYEDQEKAAHIMRKYNLISLPVVDNENHLLGIVTVDDIMDIMEEEQTEDIAKISAIHPETIGLELMTKIKEIPIRKLYRSRIGWLLFLLFINLITGGIIQRFEDTIAKYIVLVTFLPVLIDTAGNAGSQSATLVIRAMALKTVEFKDFFYLIFREILISSTLGFTLGLGISLIGLFRSQSLIITLCIGFSMIVNVLVGSLVGMSLPFILTKLKKDPASASAPLVTTIADILGTFSYLLLASIFLK